MLHLKEAVKLAFDAFGELFETRKFEDVLLESAEFSGENACWRVTIGFSRQVPPENIMEAFGSKKYLRSAKTFEIEDATGRIRSMTNAAE